MHLMDKIAPILGLEKYLDEPRYGIELEYENYRGDRDGIKLWDCVKDGSLRNHGVEFVSVPLKHAELRPALKLMKELIVENKRMEASNRCGVHVHLNVLPYTWNNLWSLTVMYTLLEPTIFARFAPLRKNSHFCVPMFYNTAMPELMLQDIGKLRNGVPYVVEPDKKNKEPKIGYQNVADYHGIPRGEVAEMVRNNPAQYNILQAALPRMRAKRIPNFKGPGLKVLTSSKYCAMNFSRMTEIGTVEFRQAPDTKDMKEVRVWAQFLGLMQQKANEFDDCLDILSIYEDQGLEPLLDMVNLQPELIQDYDQRNAYIAATLMAGQVAPLWDELEWNFGHVGGIAPPMIDEHIDLAAEVPDGLINALGRGRPVDPAQGVYYNNPEIVERGGQE